MIGNIVALYGIAGCLTVIWMARKAGRLGCRIDLLDAAWLGLLWWMPVYWALSGMKGGK